MDADRPILHVIDDAADSYAFLMHELGMRCIE